MASKALFDGGLGPGGSSQLMQQAVSEAAKKLKINLSKPFDELPARQQQQLLNGANDFPGILKILERTFEDYSDGVREYLMEYMSAADCTACHGMRLRPSSLAVRVKGAGIAEFTSLSVMRALEAARLWTLTPREEQIAARIVEEIRNRLEFLTAVGLDYLSLSRSAATLFRWRSAAHPLGHADWLQVARASSMFSMSLPSACIRGTTTNCWRRWRT